MLLCSSVFNALCHLLGKGWPLGSRLWCLSVSLSLSHWYPGSNVVLYCINSWSLHPYLLSNLLVSIWYAFINLTGYHFYSAIRNLICHITHYSLMFFIGQVHVFAGQVKIISHSSCRTSAILKYFCPWCRLVQVFTGYLCGLIVLLLYVASQQLWSWRDGQFT